MAVNSNNVYLAGSPVIPNALNVVDITNEIFSQVTVDTANYFVAGQKIYFSIPFGYGMFQANGKTAQILSVNEDNTVFTTDLNTTQFDEFVTPSSGEMPATVSPQGSVNIYNFTTVPFRALDGNVGN